MTLKAVLLMLFKESSPADGVLVFKDLLMRVSFRTWWSSFIQFMFLLSSSNSLTGLEQMNGVLLACASFQTCCFGCIPLE
jgi:hypothetical protein